VVLAAEVRARSSEEGTGLSRRRRQGGLGALVIAIAIAMECYVESELGFEGYKNGAVERILRETTDALHGSPPLYFKIAPWYSMGNKRWIELKVRNGVQGGGGMRGWVGVEIGVCAFWLGVSVHTFLVHGCFICILGLPLFIRADPHANDGTGDAFDKFHCISS
jgi:hypothetical protein